MSDFITDKIINDTTSLIITKGDENQIKLMNSDRYKHFIRSIKILKKKKYYIPNMFNVYDDNKLTYTVAVPWYVEDCYDFIEYAAYDQILYCSLTYSYDVISNPHLIVEGNKISIDSQSLVKSCS
jgi:hypothetical protein